MNIKQEIRKRGYDNQFVVWQMRNLTLRNRVERDMAHVKPAEREAYYERFWKPCERWVAVAVLSTFREAAVFAEEARKSERAPLFAGSSSTEAGSASEACTARRSA